MPLARLVVPGLLGGVTGGNLYDLEVVAALERRGWDVHVAEDADANARDDVVMLDSLAFPRGAPAVSAPIVAIAHQLPSEANGRPEWRAAERDALGAASLVVAVAPHVAREVEVLSGVRARVVPPGRDRAAASDHAPEDEVLVVANAVRGKGIPDAVRAFGRASLPGATLVLAGDLEREPEEAAEIRAALEETDAPVVPVGVLDPGELRARYAAATVLLTASGYEGWPIAVVEAMATGVPVVGYAIPGISEVAGSGGGLLVSPGDVAALGAALRYLWGDGELRARLSTEARRRSEAWPTWRETGDRVADLVERASRQATGAR